MKRLLVFVVSVTLMLLTFVGLATPANAHEPVITAGCDGVTAAMTKAPSGHITVLKVTVGTVTQTKTVDGNGSLTVPVPQGGATTDWSAEVDAAKNQFDKSDSGKVGPCPPPQVIDEPAEPGTEDPCGPNNIKFLPQVDTDKLDWTLLSNGNLTVSPKPGYKFKSGKQILEFTLPADSNEPCPARVIAVPGQPQVADPCGPRNNAFILPADTESLDWTLLEGGDVKVTPKPGYKFDGEEQSKTFKLPADSNVPCPVGQPQPQPLTPVTPLVTFTDPTCENLNGSGWFASNESVLDYTQSTSPGLGKTVTVTAAIEPGLTGTHKFADGARTQWTHTFPTLDDLDCVAGEETVVPKPKPDKKPTVKGVAKKVPQAAPVAAPTAVAAGVGSTAPSALQTIAQALVAGVVLLVMAGAWIGLGRRETGTHEA